MPGKNNEKAGRGLVQAQRQAPTPDIEAGSHHANQCVCASTPRPSGARSLAYWTAGAIVIASLLGFMLSYTLKIEFEASGCTPFDWSTHDYSTSDVIKSLCFIALIYFVSFFAVNGMVAFKGCDALTLHRRYKPSSVEPSSVDEEQG